MIRSTSMESLPPGGSVRLDFSFLFVGLHFPPHCDFGKSKKKKKKKYWQDIIPDVVCIKQWSLKMIKLEITAHYLNLLDSNVQLFLLYKSLICITLPR